GAPSGCHRSRQCRSQRQEKHEGARELGRPLQEYRLAFCSCRRVSSHWTALEIVDECIRKPFRPHHQTSCLKPLSTASPGRTISGGQTPSMSPRCTSRRGANSTSF